MRLVTTRLRAFWWSPRRTALGRHKTCYRKWMHAVTPELFNSTTIPILEQVINFAQSRHNVLAGNVANMDTPGYRVRDLSVETFQDRLKEVLEARKLRPEPWSPGVTSHRPNDPMREVKESTKSILYHDDSNVGLDQQVNEILKNQGMHNMAIAVMNSQFRLLQTAITERV